MFRQPKRGSKLKEYFYLRNCRVIVSQHYRGMIGRYWGRYWLLIGRDENIYDLSSFVWVSRNNQTLPLTKGNHPLKTLPKAQRTRGLSPSCQSNFLRSYHKFKHKSWAHFIFRIPSKHQLKISTKHQHLHILTKPSFGISTKTQLHNLYKTSAAKCWTNSSFKILPELQLQNLDQPLCSKSEQKFSFRTKRHLPNL